MLLVPAFMRIAGAGLVVDSWTRLLSGRLTARRHRGNPVSHQPVEHIPTDPARMHRFDPAMTQMILDYVRERLALAEAPVDGLGDRTTLEAAVAGLIGPGPREAREVLDVYIDALADTVLSADSPRYLAFIPAAPTKAALLFDMIVSAASLQGCSWLEAAGVVVAENQALRVLADAAGLPSGAGGVFVSGGSAGNLSALVVARDVARYARDHASVDGGRRGAATPAVVVSDQAHSSVAATLNITAMDAIVVPTSQGRLDAQALRRGLVDLPEEDLRRVVAIVATAGTTNAGIIDDIAAAADVAEEHGWWLHVDGAYGGAGLLAPAIRPRYAGIERADSIVMDPHKWWFAPYDCAALLYREPRLAKAVHTQDASYLDVIHEHDDDVNPSDLAYHLTRRARGLPLWFSMAVNGLDAYRDAVQQGIDIARYAAARITEAGHLRLVMEPELSVVLFTRVGWTLADYEAWSATLLASQCAFVTHSKWQGEPVGRLAFLHPGTTPAMVDEVLGTLA